VGVWAARRGQRRLQFDEDDGEGRSRLALQQGLGERA
jgi:hypothetical protein